MQAIQMLR